MFHQVVASMTIAIRDDMQGKEPYDSRRAFQHLPPGGVLGLCLVLFATKVFWTDLRILNHDISGNPYRAMLVVHTALLAPFIVYGLWAGRREIKMSYTVWAFGLITAIGAIGMATQESVRWTSALQDVARLTFIPAAIALTLIDPPQHIGRFLDRLAIAVLAMIFAKVSLFLLHGSDTGYLYYGSIFDAFPFCVFAARYCRADGRSLRLYSTLAAISLVIVVVGLKRANFGVVSVATAFLLVCHWRSLWSHRVRFSLGVVAVVTSIGFSAEIAQSIDSRLTREATPPDAKGRATEVRIHELRAIGDTIADGDPIQQLFGFGHGATFVGLPSYDTGETVKHTVHFTPAALAFRYGPAGLVFLTVLTAGLFMPVLKRDFAIGRRVDTTWMTASDAIALRTFAVGSLASSAMEFGFVDDMLVGFAIGVLLVDRQRSGLESQQVRASMKVTETVKLQAA